MAINLDFDTHQKLLRVAGMMNMSVQALSNKLLRGACTVLDAESLERMMNDAAQSSAKTVVRENKKRR